MKLGVGYDNGKAMVLGRGRASAGGEYDRNILNRNFKELTKIIKKRSEIKSFI